MFALAITILIPKSSPAEQLGELGLGEFLLQPAFVIESEDESGFELYPSFLDFVWSKNNQYQAHFVFGDTSLIGVPVFFGANPTDYGLLQAYGEVSGWFGNFKAGLIPLIYGTESGISESTLDFPRSLIYESRLLHLRDYGVQYSVSNEGFFTDMAVHNGEAGPDQDNRFWYTGRVGWKDGKSFGVGMSGTTGRYKILGGDLHIRRAGGLFARGKIWGFDATLEGSYGEDIVQDEKSPFGGWHFDLEHSFIGTSSLLFRFDHVDPNTKVGKDMMQRGSLGVSVFEENFNSVFYAFYHRKYSESEGGFDNQVLLLWKLTSLHSE
jgi:hypothetical protein